MAFPDAIDNSFRSTARACMTQARYRYIEDLSPPGESVHLHFGGSVAYGLEQARRAFHDEHKTVAEAVEIGAQAAWDYYGPDFTAPIKSPKTRENAKLYIRYYFTIWPLDSDAVQPTRAADGSLRVEWRFKFPIPDLIHPDHGGPIYYVGRSDMIATLMNMPTVEDDKSATQLGEKWANQWQLDGQFLGYVWAAQQDGILVPDQPGTALIRGVGVYTPKFVKPGTESYVKATGADLQEMVQKGEAEYSLLKSFGHSQAIVHHAPWMIARWLRQLKRDVGRLIYAYINDPDGTKGEWDLALDKSSCGGYGGCAYTDLCMSENPEQWKAINFVKRRWDPLETV